MEIVVGRRTIFLFGFVALGIIIAIIFFRNGRSPFQPKSIDEKKKVLTSTQRPEAGDLSSRQDAHPSGKRSLALSNFESDPRVERILAKSSPEARASFEKALEVLRSGDPLEAFGQFHSMTWKYRDDSVKPLAEWGMALAYYRTGGPGYVLFAAEHFNQYCDKYAGSEELDFLVRAAANNKDFIEKELNEFDPAELLTSKWELRSEEQRQNYRWTDPITLAQKYVEAFLSEHPQSPLQNNAKQILIKIQEFSKRR
jgi:outer membrane protein assembly factor BamD (BamD/ComL family)